MADSPVREEAARLLANATPGPWKFEFGEVCQSDAPWDDVVAPEVDRGSYCYGCPVTRGFSDADAEFIAAAPTLVADLLALTASDRSEIDRLRTSRDRWFIFASDIIDSFGDTPEGWVWQRAFENLVAAEPVSTGLAPEPEATTNG